MLKLKRGGKCRNENPVNLGCKCRCESGSQIQQWREHCAAGDGVVPAGEIDQLPGSPVVMSR